MKRPTLTTAAWISLAAPPLAALAGWVGLMFGMGGTIAGVFIVALVPVILLAALPPLMRGVIGKYGRAAWIRVVFGVWALASLSFLLLVAPVALLPVMADPPWFLPKTSDGKRATRLEFRFQRVTRVVHDPHGRIRFYDGKSPEVVSQADGSGLLVFRGEGFGLSTWSDRVSVSEDCFNIGGWMGARTADEEIRVTEEGGFDTLDTADKEIRVTEEGGFDTLGE